MGEEAQSEEKEPIDVRHFVNALDLMAHANMKYAEKVDERFDSLDRLHANLAMSVMEIATTLEALSQEVMASKTDEEKQAFLERVESLKEDTLSVLQSMINQGEEPQKDEQEEG